MSTLTEYFEKRLNALFSDYLKDFSRSNISQLSLGINNNLVMENLEIREDLLLMNSIPLVISDGKISRIRINVPMLFKNIAMRIDIENVEIHVRLLVEHRISDDKKKKVHKTEEEFLGGQLIGTESYKSRKLRDWEDKVKKYFQELAPPTWAKKTIDNILKNMVISIKNLNIYYESYSLLNVPSLIKVSFRELNIHTTDEQGFPTFNSASNLHFREINLTGFSITLNLNKQAQQQQAFSGFRRDDRKKTTTKLTYANIMTHIPSDRKNMVKTSKGRYVYDEREALEGEYRKLKEHDTYLLFPFDAMIKIKTQLDLSKDFSVEPIRQVWIEFKDPIIFVLNHDHVKYLAALNDHINLMRIVQKNIHLRPTEPPKEKPYAWWVYAIKAVTEERKRTGSLLKNSTRNLLNMRKYIDLYKRKQTIIHVPWLPRITQEEGEIFNKLEEEIPLANLLEFREWAFIEIRVEAKRFFASNKDVQGMKPLIDIWSNAINNEEAFTSTKEKSSETIRLTPIEQADLYEILSQDKAKVLESYLKGENNDPKDIMLELTVNIKSLYLLVSEPKESSIPLLINPTRFEFHGDLKKGGSDSRKGTRVRTWWKSDQKATNPTVQPLNHEVSIEEEFPTTKRFLIQPGTPENLTENQSFHTVPDEEEKLEKNPIQGDQDDSPQKSASDSFMEHLKDVDSSQKGHFKEDEDESINKRETRTDIPAMENRREINDWWNQNLILLVEILDTSISLKSFRNGALSTKKPLECKSIMITTALNLPNAVAERDKEAGNLSFKLNYHTLLKRIIAYDFSFAFPDQQGNTNPLIRYMRENGCENIASFLEIYNKDGRSTGDLTVNLDNYRPFFEYGNPKCLDFSPEVVHIYETFRDFQNPSGITKEEVIDKAFSELEKHINSVILPTFLYSYGVLVIPLMFQAELLSGGDSENIYHTEANQKEITSVFSKLKRFPTTIRSMNLIKFLLRKKSEKSKPQQNPTANASILSLDFSIEGTQSQFKIQRVDFTYKKKKKENVDIKIERKVEEEEGRTKHQTGSNITLTIRPFKIYLSVESIKPIAKFIDSLSSTAPNDENNEKDTNYDAKDPLSVDDFQNMMNCINFNPNNKQERRYENIPNIIAQIKELEVIITNHNSHYMFDRRLNFSIHNLELRIKRPKPVDSKDEAINEEMRKLEKNYMTVFFKIDTLKLIESFKLLANKDFEKKVILATKVIAYIYDCVYANHPLYTDRKVHILIPYLKITIDDIYIMLTEVIQTILALNTEEKTAESGAGPNGTNFIAMGNNQKILLTNRLKALLSDHRVENKNCKHCILRHKKSNLIMNLFIGNITEYFEMIHDSSFVNLYHVEIEDESPGLAIAIDHFLTPKPASQLRTVLYIPFIAVSKDVGYFKDNTVVHSTESFPLGPKVGYTDDKPVDNQAILSAFRPLIKAEKGVIGELDDNLWKYFRALEKKLAAKPEQNGKISEIPLSKNYIHNLDDLTAKRNSSSLRLPQTDTNLRRDSDASETTSKNLYVVLFRKKYLKKELLREFEIKGKEKNFSNVLIARIQEIKFKFNTIKAFCSVLNTLDNLNYLSTWFEQFYKSNAPPTNRKLELLSDRRANKKKPITHQDVKNLLESENVSIIIDKMKLNIQINPPQHAVKLSIKKFIFENLPDKTFHPSIGNNELSIRNLLYVQEIGFRTNTMASGTIEEIKLRYLEKTDSLDFSIKRIFYERPKKKNEYLFESPASDYAYNPTGLGADVEKKALQVQFLFVDNLLTQIIVLASPLRMYLSTSDLSQELGSFELFNSIFAQERASLPNAITLTIFEKTLFEKTHYEVMRLKKLKKIPVEDVLNEAEPCFGSFAAHPDMHLAFMCDKLTVRCAMGGKELAIIDLDKIKFEIDTKMDYRAEFGRFSLIPCNCDYENFLMDLSSEDRMIVRLFKKDEYPVLAVRNAKIIYVARVIKELVQYKKELQEKIIATSKSLRDEASAYDCIYADNEVEKNIEDQEFDKTPFFKVLITDSAIIVPRNSKSKDVFVLSAKKILTTIDRECMSIEMPVELKAPFDIVSGDQILTEKELYRTVRGAFFTAEAELEQISAFYSVDNRRVRLGKSKYAKVSVVNPDDDIEKDGWLFDNIVTILLQEYDFLMNQASIDEVKELIMNNLREYSETCPTKIKIWEKTRLNIFGNQLGVNIDRSITPVELVKEYLLDKSKLPKEEGTVNLAEHLDDLISDMYKVSQSSEFQSL